MVASTTLLAGAGIHPPGLCSHCLRSARNRCTARQGWFNRAREFPNMRHSELRRDYKEGERAINEPVPMLQRYLPFWVANLIERDVGWCWDLLAALLLCPASYRRCTSSGCARAFSAGTAARARSKTRWSPNLTRPRNAAGASMRWKPRLVAGPCCRHTPTSRYALRNHIHLIRRKLMRPRGLGLTPAPCGWRAPCGPAPNQRPWKPLGARGTGRLVPNRHLRDEGL